MALMIDPPKRTSAFALPRWGWGGRGWAALGLGLLASAALAQQGIYTCTDARGRTYTADRPIAECSDRVQRELGPSGTLKRQVPPSLSPQEQAAQEDAKRKAQEERHRADEERRRERALVIRYPNRPAHDKERNQQLAQAQELSQLAQQRIAGLHEQRAKLDNQAEAYRQNPARMPATLARQIEENQRQLQAQRRLLQEQGQEIERINQRFDTELVLLQRLWLPAPAAGTAGGGSSTGSASAANALSGAASSSAAR